MVIIYSASWCAPCRFAKQLLNEKGVKFNEIDIEKKGISRQDLEKLTGGSTVPQICINNEYIPKSWRWGWINRINWARSTRHD